MNIDTLIEKLDFLKQHAVINGDCVFVYDPVADQIVESTECFEEITGIAVTSKDIKQQWLAKIETPSLLLSQDLLKSNDDNSAKLFEYEIEHGPGKLHQVRQLVYPYYYPNKQQQFILGTLRDCTHEYVATPVADNENWRDENSSQLRHLRKIISIIAKGTLADFIMLAVPGNEVMQARTLVTMQDGAFIDDVSYDLQGTPCEITVSGKLCTHEADIQSLYPTDEMLVEMGAESYAGIPFFDNHGEVIGYLVLINRKPLDCFALYHKLIESYQPQIARRLQLYFVDKRLSELQKSEFVDNGFDNAQFLLGSTPSSKELANWAKISQETFSSVKEAILITDASNTIVQCNQAFTDITGYSQQEVIGKNPNILSSGIHNGDFYQEMNKSLIESGMWEGEIINKTKAGKSYSEWLYIRVVYNEAQEVTHYIAVFSDISKHKEKEELLYFQANYDPLTMLPNRSLLFYLLAEALSKLVSNQNKPIYLMHIDLNGLARINENYDYYVGDTLLIETSNRLKVLVGENATVARISGDNFVIMIPDEDEYFAITDIAEQVCQKLNEPVIVNDYEVKISANIGIASTLDASISTENFYTRAEHALYNAKLAGPGHYFVYDEALQQQVKNSWQIEQDLAVAIAEDQFVLFYQPQIDAASKQVIGVEALVRWQHPKSGLLAPGFFIEIAEKTNQIVELGNLILKKACKQINIWSDSLSYKFNVSVNISPRQFALEQSHKYMHDIINESGVDKSRLILEITEDVLMTNHKELLEILTTFNDEGIRLSIDDFGTGFSSLSYLQQYPLNELKIDQSFVRTLGSKPETHSIVKAIISMAKGLDLKVVAEGVETLSQHNILKSLGCDIFQGYYFAKPMPTNELVDYIKG